MAQLHREHPLLTRHSSWCADCVLACALIFDCFDAQQLSCTHEGRECSNDVPRWCVGVSCRHNIVRHSDVVLRQRDVQDASSSCLHCVAVS
jgi:hypothetical protein